jgi:hypothetical protein
VKRSPAHPEKLFTRRRIVHRPATNTDLPTECNEGTPSGEMLQFIVIPSSSHVVHRLITGKRALTIAVIEHLFIVRPRG